jgi:hypothetical protein
MKTEKMTYEKPTVQKVEFDFKTRIAASGCAQDLNILICTPPLNDA